METILNFLSTDGLHPVVLFAVILLLMAIGDVLSIKSKAVIPSLLVFALLLLFASWLKLIPPNIAELAGINGSLSTLMLIIMVTNMGTSINIKDIIGNWRVAIISLGALCGVVIFVLAIGSQLFGWQTAVIAAPAVGGGIVAALEMQNAANAIGNVTLAAIALFVLLFHSFPGFIGIPPLLKKAMRKDLETVDLDSELEKLAGEDKKQRKTILPEKYQTNTIIFFLIALLSALAVVSSMLSSMVLGGFAISASIFALFYGVIATHFGLLPQNALDKANANGLVFLIVIIGALGSLTSTTPESVASLILPIFGVILLGVCGIVIVSVIVGKIFKYEWPISISIGLNCLLGFPLNYLVALESIKSIAKNEKEEKYLVGKFVPIMLVAGFTAITLGSVILAGILKNFL